MQEAQLQKLIKIIKAEYSIYQEIYSLSKDKEDVIISENIEVLEQITQKEEEYLNQIKQLEIKRQALVEGSISKVIATASEVYAEKLRNIRDLLSELVEKLDGRNQLNNQLIDNALSINNFNLNLLTNNTKQGTYGKRGNDSSQGKQNSVLNHKA